MNYFKSTKFFMLFLILSISFPCIAEDLNKFIPKGYGVYNQTSGDINLDGINDTILVLKKNNEEKLSTIEHPVKRITMILIGQKDGTLKLACKNENAVYYYGYDPNFVDCFTDITLGKGKFSVNHYGGFANRWELTITFSFVPDRNNFVLSEYSYSIYDRDVLKGTIKDIILNQKELGDIYFMDFDIYKKMF